MSYRLTPGIQERVAQYVRAGGFEWVAAEAAGVPRRVFLRWMQRGQRSRQQPYRGFRDAIVQARAQARLKAEVETREKTPRDWLRLGPGRELPGRPGWTNPAKAGTAAHASARSDCDSKEMRWFLALVKEVLVHHPEARVAVAERMDRKPKPRWRDFDEE